MTTTKNIQDGIKSLKRNTRETTNRLCDLGDKFGFKSDSMRAQELSVEDIASGGFTADEAAAILFVLAEIGRDLDSVDHFVIFGW